MQKKNTKKEFTSQTDKNFKTMVAIGGVVVGLAVILTILIVIIMLSGSKSESGGRLGGLMNDKNLLEPKEVTAQDLEDEYESREEMSMSTQEMLESTVSQRLNYGAFVELDSFLSQQQKLYKNAEGDEGQAMDDWKNRFDILRGDLTKTINLTSENAAQTFASYYDAEILAAAIAYAPISAKLDAFVDWSAVIMPPAIQDGTHSINLTLVEYEDHAAELAKINETANEPYIDVVAYDMTILGYQFRFISVMDKNGFMIPYSMLSLDGLMDEGMTKTDIKAIQNQLDVYTDIDSAISVPECDPNESLTQGSAN